MYSGRHNTFIVYRPVIYKIQPLEGCTAYAIKEEGLGCVTPTQTGCLTFKKIHFPVGNKRAAMSVEM